MRHMLAIAAACLGLLVPAALAGGPSAADAVTVVKRSIDAYNIAAKTSDQNLQTAAFRVHCSLFSMRFLGQFPGSAGPRQVLIANCINWRLGTGAGYSAYKILSSKLAGSKAAVTIEVGGSRGLVTLVREGGLWRIDDIAAI